MPELPEVETVRRGLAPVLDGSLIVRAEAHRPDLRFPLPDGFVARLTGQRILSVSRRAKYLLWALSGGETLVVHLGMTGRFSVGGVSPGLFYRAASEVPHRHVDLHVRTAAGEEHHVAYADPRRFGYMDLIPSADLDASPWFRGLGPEPLDPAFTGDRLRRALAGRRSPLKAALLDQRVVAGLGNIYVCEALFGAGLSPRRLAATVGPGRAARLHAAIGDVLRAAIDAGGSTLRDFAHADGASGYFQHRFNVYDREGDRCRQCEGAITRIVQSGRSTFFCGRCQR